MPPGHERNVIYTYRYLRIAMIALLVMLLVAVGFQVAAAGCWLGSISAYYYTPVRTIFVGSLCALGVCLIAYKGHSQKEDVLLNFSGLMAFFVAMVPTAPDNLCGPNPYSQDPAEIASAVRNNIWSLIIVAVLAAVVVVALDRLFPDGGTKPKPSRLTTVVLVLCVLVVLGELILFLLLRPAFIAHGHLVAAFTMVVGVIGVMVSSAFRKEARQGESEESHAADQEVQGPPTAYKTAYLVIAGILAVTLVVTVIVTSARSSERLILWVELAVIILFCVYWAVQTGELWGRREPVAPPTQVEAEQAADNELSRDGSGSPASGEAVAASAEGRTADAVAE